MIRTILVLLALACGPAWAQPAKVTSGEHEGFTRIVLDFGNQRDWKMGRTADGYAVWHSQIDQGFDLRTVFKPIGKSRLAAISVDPRSGLLNINFACPCHAIAFEFRPGIVVVDLRDGPPPEGSSFEDPLDVSGAILEVKPQADAKGVSPNKPEQYRWIEARGRGEFQGKPIGAEKNYLAPIPATDGPDLHPLREQLLRQLSRGAADGTVEMADMAKSTRSAPKKDLPDARIALGELPGLSTNPGAQVPAPLGASGVICLSDAELAIHTWGKDPPFAPQFSEHFQKLTGELDRVDPAALQTAVKFLVFATFGKEAEQLANSMPIESSNLAFLVSMARVMDGSVQDNSPFAGQANCNTAAAMWALLVAADKTPESSVNLNAVVRSFSALPHHLRWHLGPNLIEYFLAHENTNMATKLRDSMGRSASKSRADLGAIDASIAFAEEDFAASETASEAGLSADEGDDIALLIPWTLARAAQNLPIEREIAQRLGDARAMPNASNYPNLDKAYALSLAASGDFGGAMDLARGINTPTLDAQLWALLSKIGTDDDVMKLAVLPPKDVPKLTDAETIEGIAKRLLDLGLAQDAAHWAALTEGFSPLLLGQIHLARKDARAALGAVEGEHNAEAIAIQANAYQILGDERSAAQLFSQMKDFENQRRAGIGARDAALLKGVPDSDWSALLLRAQTSPSEQGSAPLARGQSLTEQSAQTREIIGKLLSAVPQPSSKQ